MSAHTQEPSITPCLDNPIQWERKAGPAQPPSATSSVGAEDVVSLGSIRVAEMSAQLPSQEPVEGQCSSPIEREVSGNLWLVGLPPLPRKVRSSPERFVFLLNYTDLFPSEFR